MAAVCVDVGVKLDARRQNFLLFLGIFFSGDMGIKSGWGYGEKKRKNCGMVVNKIG